MKKIFSIATAALVALSFASCNKDGGNTPDDPSKPDDPAKGSFAITVSEITASSARIKVVPPSDDITYFWNVVSKDELKEAKMTLEEWAADDMVYYPEEGYSFDELASKGAEEYNVAPLEPETEYYAYAYQFNKDFKILSDVSYTEFATSKFEITGSEELNLEGAEFTWEYDTKGKEGYLALVGYDVKKNLELGLYFVVNSDTPNGTFSEADMDEPYADYGYYFNYLHDAANKIEYQLVSANVTGAYNEDKSLYVYGGEAVALNGIKYTFKNVQASEYVYEDDGENWFAPARVRKEKKNAGLQRGAKKQLVK